jgi:hypothetical protein
MAVEVGHDAVAMRKWRGRPLTKVHKIHQEIA